MAVNGYGTGQRSRRGRRKLWTERKRQLRRRPQAPLILFFFFFFFNFFFNFFLPSSLRSLLFVHFFLLSSIRIFTHILTSHRIAPSSQCWSPLLEHRVFLPYFSFADVLHLFLCVLFHSSSFPSLSFHFLISFDPFSSVFHFHFWLLLLSIFFDSRFISLLILVYVSRLLNLDARSRCLHNNFPNKTELLFGIWNGVLWYARGSRINCYGIYVILINV